MVHTRDQSSADDFKDLDGIFADAQDSSSNFRGKEVSLHQNIIKDKNRT